MNYYAIVLNDKDNTNHIFKHVNRTDLTDQSQCTKYDSGEGQSYHGARYLDRNAIFVAIGKDKLLICPDCIASIASEKA